MLFELKHCVLPEEVDAFKVVHFSNYFKWSSLAFLKFFRHKGLKEGIFEDGMTEIRVGRVHSIYNGSAKQDDIVSICIKDLTINRNSIVLNIYMIIENKIINRSRMTIAFVNSRTGELVKTPNEIKLLI
ncbi:acyl-CoA thioesterase [Lysinibacillus sp. Bpr_S20]|uniref:acyl-CoA thioesterase n=1 Tax=Lysinibacillus sp. Bpr_S20 TaxID=2933964 RepID=UPI002011F196|nr:acyl-CoA thioesterase [Lysinibacillus sp. Bpr_S20]MCL1702975.1 acyl-CoA thioesterase [Lysinibacillus sp. Bpr_S20]